MRLTTSPKEEKYQSSGQLLKPLFITNTPLPVTSGATDVCSMRYGVSDTHHLKELRTQRSSEIVASSLMLHPITYY